MNCPGVGFELPLDISTSSFLSYYDYEVGNSFRFISRLLFVLDWIGSRSSQIFLNQRVPNVAMPDEEKIEKDRCQPPEINKRSATEDHWPERFFDGAWSSM